MKKISVMFLAALMLFSPLFSQAAMVKTQALVDPAAEWLNSPALVAKMLDKGIDPAEVQARVDAMTASERAELNAALENMPAGQGVLEIAFLVFLVFVVTDLLGATDIFPFINSINTSK
ncbi:PA2779 family protein [Agaribacterium haliotis]|uniref:PA2779 family protein n=1 Tax=Agaribacterium haliotis TaxID=2013869 RepID=UPI0011784994|nr:PA2779 family protein [Agaribacterium haliotis]